MGLINSEEVPVTTSHRRSLSLALESVSCLIPLASMAPANARGTRQSAKLQRLRQRDDREVSWAAIAPPRPCHSMAWSGGIWIIYIIILFANKRVLMEQVNRLYARCCTQHITHTCSGKCHVEPAIGWLCFLQSLHSEMSVIIAALTLASQMAGFGRPMCLSLGLIRAVAGQKLHHQFLRAISLSPSLTTPVS